jgi:hypothetical protein
MKKIQKIILNPTFFAVGQALQADNDLMVIGRNSSIGDEWTYSFHQIKSSGFVPSTEITRSLLIEMSNLNLENNAVGFSVLLYKLLANCTDKFMLWTELESVKEVDDGFELSLYTVSGREIIHCRELVDTSVEMQSCPDWGKSNITSKSLNMIIDKKIEDSCQAHDFGALKMRAGRSITEFIIEYTVSPGISLPAARAELLDIWRNRPESMKDWKIVSFGSEFDYSLKSDKHTIKPNWSFINPLAFDSPIAALEAGLTRGAC